MHHGLYLACVLLLILPCGDLFSPTYPTQKMPSRLALWESFVALCCCQH